MKKYNKRKEQNKSKGKRSSIQEVIKSTLASKILTVQRKKPFLKMVIQNKSDSLRVMNSIPIATLFCIKVACRRFNYSKKNVVSINWWVLDNHHRNSMKTVSI